MRDPAPWQKRYNRMLGFSLLFGFAGQYLFVGHTAGVSVLLFVIGFYGLFYYALKGKIGGFDQWRGQSRSGWLLLLPIGLLALTYSLFANNLFRILNGLALPAMVVAQTLLLTRGSPEPWYRAAFFRDAIYQGIVKPWSFFSVPFGIALDQLAVNRKADSAAGKLRKVFFGLLLASPILVVVVSLLASADRIFLSWLNEIPALLDQFSLGNGMIRIGAGGLIALYAFCYLWGLLFRKAADGLSGSKTASGRIDQTVDRRIAFDPITAGTLLICINFVYMLFAAIQFSYLFGAAGGLLPAGATYAEYARKGFAELVIVAVINQAILFGGIHLVKHTGHTAEVTRKLSLSLLVGCTLIMLISAYSRLSLYEAAYGYTQTRLLIHGFMLFLSVLLVIACVRIWRERFSLSKAYICTAVIAYVFMNYANLDARIASNNIARYERTGKIDIAYLGTLSADAAPALLELQARHPDLEGASRILENLRRQSRRSDTWQSWNLARQRANFE